MQVINPGPAGELQPATPAVGGFYIGRALRQARRFPVIAVFVLVVLLVVPDVFANLTRLTTKSMATWNTRSNRSDGFATAIPSW